MSGSKGSFGGFWDLHDPCDWSKDAEYEGDDYGHNRGEDEARDRHVLYSEIACCIRDYVHW